MPEQVSASRHLARALADYPNAIRMRAGWLRDPAVPARFARGDRRPVVILPGVWETWHYLRVIAGRLSDAGHPVHVVPALRLNLAPIPESAELVAAELERAGIDDAAVVAHSKGGLIAKQLLLTAAAPRIHGIVAIATPFAGSRMASYVPFRSMRAFHPAHPHIRALVTERSLNARITSIYPRFDPHIPDGSRLEGATNVELPVVGHFRVLLDERTVAAVLDAVAADG